MARFSRPARRRVAAWLIIGVGLGVLAVLLWVPSGALGLADAELSQIAKAMLLLALGLLLGRRVGRRRRR